MSLNLGLQENVEISQDQVQVKCSNEYRSDKLECNAIFRPAFWKSCLIIENNGPAGPPKFMASPSLARTWALVSAEHHS